MTNSPRQPNQPEDRDASKIARRKISPNDGGLDLGRQPQIETYQSESLEQSVVFQQSRGWSRGIIWTIMGITTGLIAWACLAPLEEAVSVQGKLEPIDKVKDVQVPIGGVVQQVLVKDGDKVTAGQNLLNLESAVAKTNLTSLQSNLASLAAESSFYRSLLAQGANKIDAPSLSKLNVRPEILALAGNRNSLVAENQLYRAELNGSNLANLSAEQRQRLESSRNELASRLSAGQLEVGQLENQMRENRGKRDGLSVLLKESQAVTANIDAKTAAKRAQIAAQMSENRNQRHTSTKLLATNQAILNSLRPAGDAGALSRNQVLKQEQEVMARQSEVRQLDDRYHKLVEDERELIASAKLEVHNQQQQIEKTRQDIAQLDREYNRLTLAANQGREKLKNSSATSQKDLLAKIADNDKRIAEIDGQLNKTIVEIDRKIADLNSQIAQAKTNLKYQQVKAPVSGTIFELKANTPGFVANTSEPVLKIVPDNNLNAKVFITNKDIGFVKTGMTVDVRLDTFPFSEFGDVKGKIISLGSDALPPDQQHPYERFPAVIKLEKQNLVIKGNPVTLQSGMALSANIKLRDRTVMSIFTDMLVKQQDALKTVR